MEYSTIDMLFERNYRALCSSAWTASTRISFPMIKSRRVFDDCDNILLFTEAGCCYGSEDSSALYQRWLEVGRDSVKLSWTMEQQEMLKSVCSTIYVKHTGAMIDCVWWSYYKGLVEADWEAVKSVLADKLDLCVGCTPIVRDKELMHKFLSSQIEGI